MIGQRTASAQADIHAHGGASEVCSYLDWDSAFFDKRIARANCTRLDESKVSELLHWCRHNRIDCLYFLGETDDAETVRIAEQNNFLEVDVRLTLARPMNQQDRSPAAAQSRVRLARGSDFGVLRQLARTLHSDSRFYHDEHFDRDQCGLLYAAWLEKSFNDASQTVFVPEADGQPVGYITCERRGQETQIGLLGIAPAFAGQGLGKALVQQFIEWSALKASRLGTVVTQQRNSAAQALYRHCGFLPVSAQRWYHRWFTND